jgi:hypothetical protein
VNYIERFLEDPMHDYYIPCRDEKDQENKRVGLFHSRRKFGDIVEASVGITKKTINEQLFVVIYKKDIVQGFRMIDGEFVPDQSPAFVADKNRRIKLMRQDGLSEDEIEKLLREEEEGESKC